MLMELLAYALLISLCSLFAGAAKFNPADKIRANANKLAKQNVRITQKQQQAPQSKALTPKFGGKRTGKTSNSKRGISGFNTKSINSDSPILQLFIRRADTGPWSYFNEIAAEGRLRPLAEDIIDSGGLQAEILRVTLERRLTRKMFGRDFWILSCEEGTEDVDNDVDNTDDDGDIYESEKESLSPLDERERFDAAYAAATESRKKLVKAAKESAPAFRKVHARDVQFGYRIHAEGEPIYHIPSHLDLLQTSSYASNKPFYWDDGSLRYEESYIEPIDMDEILNDRLQPKASTPESVDWSRCLGAISSMVKRHLSRKNSFPSVATLDPYSKLTKGGERKKIEGEDGNRGDNEDDAFAFDLYICSDGSAHLRQKKCTKASGGIFAAFLHDLDAEDVNSSDGALGLDALALHLSDVAGFVSSPFDAELAASIGSIILAKRMVNEYASLSLSASSGEPSKLRGRITFLTDSKTLCRSLRSSPSSNQFMERSTPSRIASWRFLLHEIDTLARMGHSIHTRWIPGHPERRHRSFDEWSFLDGAIWAADLFASDDEAWKVTYNNGQGTEGKSTKNNIDVLDSEVIRQCRALGLELDSPTQDNIEQHDQQLVRIAFKEMVSMYNSKNV